MITVPLAGPDSATTILSAGIPAMLVCVTGLPWVRLASAWSFVPPITRTSIGGMKLPEDGTCAGTAADGPNATTLTAPPDPGSAV